MKQITVPGPCTCSCEEGVETYTQDICQIFGFPPPPGLGPPPPCNVVAETRPCTEEEATNPSCCMAPSPEVEAIMAPSSTPTAAPTAAPSSTPTPSANAQSVARFGFSMEFLRGSNEVKVACDYVVLCNRLPCQLAIKFRKAIARETSRAGRRVKETRLMRVIEKFERKSSFISGNCTVAIQRV